MLVKVEDEMSKVILLAAVLVAAVGCRTPGAARCPVGETRCEGEVAQICDPGGQWQTLADCERVSELNRAPFTCQPILIEDGEVGRLEGHTCMPAGGVRADAGVGEDGGGR